MRITLQDRTIKTGPTPKGITPTAVVSALLSCAERDLEGLRSPCYYRADGTPIDGIGPIRIEVERRRPGRILEGPGEEPLPSFV